MTDLEDKILGVLIERLQADRMTSSQKESGWMTPPRIAEELGADRRTIYFHRDSLTKLQYLGLIKTRPYSGRGSHASSVEYRANPAKRLIQRRMEVLDLRSEYTAGLSEDAGIIEEVKQTLNDIGHKLRDLSTSDLNRTALVAGGSRMLARPDACLDEISLDAPILSLFHTDTFAASVASALATLHEDRELSPEALQAALEASNRTVRRLGLRSLELGPDLNDPTRLQFEAVVSLARTLHRAPIRPVVLVALTWICHRAVLPSLSGIAFFGSLPQYARATLRICAELSSIDLAKEGEEHTMPKAVREVLESSSLFGLPWDSEW